MPQFGVNPPRFNPYQSFKFRVKWDGRYVAGVSKVTALKRTTKVVAHRGAETAALCISRHVQPSTNPSHSSRG